MEFRYSNTVDSESYRTDGLCGRIPLRIHKDPLGEINGAVRCQKDWSEHVSPVANFKGTLGTPFSFIRVSIPEALPERLEIISYANEYAFIYDDVITENLNGKLDSTARGAILEEFSHDITSVDRLSGTYRLNGAKKIQGQIFKEMLKIDKERAITTMEAWQTFVEVVSSRQRSEPFASLDEYLPYRISDAGELFWFGLVTFGMGLTIPEEEMQLCKKLGRPAWEALVLTNDLYSWDKERQEAASLGETNVVNAIWVLMQEHGLTEKDAKQLCRLKIKQSVEDATRLVEETRSDEGLSPHLRKYLEALLYSISGNLVWSIYCPRYHPEQTLGEVELRKMAEVTGIRPRFSLTGGASVL